MANPRNAFLVALINAKFVAVRRKGRLEFKYNREIVSHFL